MPPWCPHHFAINMLLIKQTRPLSAPPFHCKRDQALLARSPALKIYSPFAICGQKIPTKTLSHSYVREAGSLIFFFKTELVWTMVVDWLFRRVYATEKNDHRVGRVQTTQIRGSNSNSFSSIKSFGKQSWLVRVIAALDIYLPTPQCMKYFWNYPKRWVWPTFLLNSTFLHFE